MNRLTNEAYEIKPAWPGETTVTRLYHCNGELEQYGILTAREAQMIHRRIVRRMTAIAQATGTGEPSNG